MHAIGQWQLSVVDEWQVHNCWDGVMLSAYLLQWFLWFAASDHRLRPADERAVFSVLPGQHNLLLFTRVLSSAACGRQLLVTFLRYNLFECTAGSDGKMTENSGVAGDSKSPDRVMTFCRRISNHEVDVDRRLCNSSRPTERQVSSEAQIQKNDLDDDNCIDTECERLNKYPDYCRTITIRGRFALWVRVK